MFRKTFVIQGAFLFFEVKGRYKESFVKLLLFADLLRGCYLFEILHTSSAMKISKNVLKTAVNVSKSFCDVFLELKEGSCLV